jgi:hypothetical protein
MQPGIWNRVLKDKYLPHLPVITWLRSAVPSSRVGSQTWKNLLNALPLLVRWLAWKPGNGADILVGKDVILGMGNDAFLSNALIQHLNEQQVHYLYQARGAIATGLTVANWVTSTDLGLSGTLATEWENYRIHLTVAGISPTDDYDEIRWTGGDGTCIITTKNIYNALAAELWQKNSDIVKRKIWSWECPLKLKLFTWLLMEDKILTWNNLLKRGWQGPGYCYLCKGNEETTFHLFVHCPFTISIWCKTCIHLKVHCGWSGTSIKDCFDSWCTRNSNLPYYTSLYLLVCLD